MTHVMLIAVTIHYQNNWTHLGNSEQFTVWMPGSLASNPDSILTRYIVTGESQKKTLNQSRRWKMSSTFSPVLLFLLYQGQGYFAKKIHRWIEVFWCKLQSPLPQELRIGCSEKQLAIKVMFALVQNLRNTEISIEEFKTILNCPSKTMQEYIPASSAISPAGDVRKTGFIGDPSTMSELPSTVYGNLSEYWPPTSASGEWGTWP